MKKVILTYFTDKETSLEKLGNLEKSGKVFNDKDLVCARTKIQTFGLSDSRASTINDRRKT